MAYARPQFVRRRPGLRGLGDATTLTLPTASVADYTRAMKETALKAAAAQMAVSIALAYIPIVGWALGLVYSLIGVFSARYDKAKIKETTDALTDAINRVAAAYSGQYDLAVNAVYGQEQANALAEIAAGNTGPDPVPATLAGLGDSFFQDVGNTLAKGFAQVATAVPRAVGVTVLKVAATGASLVGANTVAKKISSGETQYINLADRGTDALTHDITHGSDAVSHAGDLLRDITGEQAVFEARAQAASIQDQFNAAIKAQYDTQVAQIQSPQFRATLRSAIKQLLQAQPGLITALNDSKTRTMVLAAAGAAVFGWFTFLKK